MLHLVVLCALFFTIPDSATCEPEWNSLRATYTPIYLPGISSAFFDLPRTLEEATSSDEWVVPDAPLDDGDYLGNPVTLANDNRVAVLLDDNGYVCGIQVGIPVAEVEIEENPYPFERHPIFQKVNRYGEDIYLTTLYTVDPSIIENGGRSAEDFEAQGTGTGLYIQKGSSSEITKVEFSPDGPPTDPLWYPERCIPGMGDHYYYNVTENLECEDFEPIFLLHKNNNLLGFGYQAFGTVTTPARSWFESIPLPAIPMTFYEYPQCLPDTVSSVGIVSFHVYFQDEPWAIGCSASEIASSVVAGVKGSL